MSPGSQAVMNDLKTHGSSGLNPSGTPSGGSRSFKVLQQLTDEGNLQKKRLTLKTSYLSFKNTMLSLEIIQQYNKTHKKLAYKLQNDPKHFDLP